MNATAKQTFCILVLGFQLATAAFAQAGPLEGTYLYRVSTVRAAPGFLDELIAAYEQEISVSRAEGEPTSMVMRHSQGDHWDLLLIYPMKSFADYYGAQRMQLRSKAAEKREAIDKRLGALISFQADTYAYGPSLSVVRNAHAGADLFHIEMFHALPGKKQALLEQRRMENRYLTATGQRANVIFDVATGTDVDVFTIGFHPSLMAFAKPAPVTNSEAEAAAAAAGFESRSTIGTYLRELISRHHDTLAVSISRD